MYSYILIYRSGFPASIQDLSRSVDQLAKDQAAFNEVSPDANPSE